MRTNVDRPQVKYKTFLWLSSFSVFITQIMTNTSGTKYMIFLFQDVEHYLSSFPGFYCSTSFHLPFLV